MLPVNIPTYPSNFLNNLLIINMTNNYSIYFIRHGKLLLPYKDHSQMPYGVIANLASEKLNPSIDNVFTKKLVKKNSTVLPFNKIKKIYTSPSKRCQETAKLISCFININLQKNISIKVIPTLKEIRFNLRKIYALPDKSHFDIEIINNNVFRSMLSGKNCENFSLSYNRVKTIFKMLMKNNNNKISLIVTHDFFMRVIELYIKNQGKNNISITFDDLKNTKRNSYLSGFATNSQLSSFLPF